MDSESKDLIWQESPNAEARLDDLRQRDLEISKISLGLQMRTRITTLEQENASLSTMRENWAMSRVSRLYFTFPTVFRALLRKISRS
jgi:hypothetical protein